MHQGIGYGFGNGVIIKLNQNQFWMIKILPDGKNKLNIKNQYNLNNQYQLNKYNLKSS